MTGEQKPGGLEPYGWIYETFAPGAGWCAGPEWWPAKFTRTPPNPETTRNVIALYTTPAEPAEARIRELERYAALGRACEQHGLAHYDDKGEMLFQPPPDAIREYVLCHDNPRATAAEAKLARAVEGLERIVHWRVEMTGTPVDTEAANAWAITFDTAATEASQTLAALQQEGE